VWLTEYAPAMVRLSVVVPATNAPATLDRCLSAIRAAIEPADEVIVVDEPTELSAVEARNVGAARAGHEVLVFVDADVEVHPDALARMRAAFAADETTAVFGSYDDAPSVATTVSTFRNLLHHHVHQSNAGPTTTFWTGLGAVRRDAFDAVGGFDADRYRGPSIEDIDLGRRLTERGARIHLDPDVLGKHLKAWTLRSLLWTDFSARGVPWVALMWRSRTVPTILNLGLRHRVSAVASVASVMALVLGSLAVFAACLALLVGLNRSFYALLVRRQGVHRAVVGVGLHAMHHLVAALAVPFGILSALVSGTGPRVPRARGARRASAVALESGVE
jgi:GT2 family glycosyltransferase